MNETKHSDIEGGGDAPGPIRGLEAPAALGAFVAVCVDVGDSTYSSWPIASIGRFILPPILLGQYVVFANGDGPRGFASWAWLSDPAFHWLIRRHEDPRPYEWRSGPNLLIADLICHPGLALPMARHLQQRILGKGSPDRLHDWEHAYAIRRNISGAVTKVARWPDLAGLRRL